MNADFTGDATAAGGTAGSDFELPEEELTDREADAARALKSAMLGVLFCPLQLYTAWLLFLVLFDGDRLRLRYFWYAVWAAAILLIYTTIVALAFIPYLFD